MCPPKAYAPRRVCMQLPFLFIYTGWRASSGSQASPIATRPCEELCRTKDVTQAISGHSSPRRVADSPTRVESSSWEGQNLRLESSRVPRVLEYSRVFREFSSSLYSSQRDPRLESSRVAGRVKYFDSS